MKNNKIVLYLCLICCLAALSGCVYLRLNKVKGQLAQFDEYFEIIEDDDFYLVCKKPVLYSRDIVWMMESAPTSQQKQDQELAYDYVLEKQYPSQKDEADTYDITIEFAFANDKLSKVMIEKRFFAIFPKTFFIELLKALGGATVDKKKRTVSARHETKYKTKPGDEPAQKNVFKVLDINEVTSLLGAFYSKKDNIYTYKYLPKKPPSVDDQQEKYYIAEFTFDKESGEMLKCSSDLYGSKIEMSFSTIFDKPDTSTSPEDTNDTQPAKPES